jgi:DNA polymerase (family 10)
MANRDIAAVFAQIADLMEILGEDRFRINSYRKASRIVEDLTEELAAVAARGELGKIAGVGKSTAAKIEQFLAAGKVDLHEELLARVPDGLTGLLDVQGLGPKTVAKLWHEADVKNLDELRAAVTDTPERLTAIGGMGPRKVEQIREALAFLATAAGRIRLGEAADLAEEMLVALWPCENVVWATRAGSLRRGRETIGDIDILCGVDGDPRAALDAFANHATVEAVLARGETKCSVRLASGTNADLRVVAQESMGAALAYFTGSKAHNVRLRELAVKAGLRLNEYGLFDGETRIAGEDEESIYTALALPFIAPELREDRGEIEAARNGELPKLLEPADIRGDLHMHTVASDGHNTIDEMVAACRDRGYAYMAICDHSKSQIQANGLDADRLAEHAAAIRAANERYDDIEVLAGVEVDIFKDGTLDFDAEVLGELDFVTASCHSALKMGRAEAAERIVRAIATPHVHCIGHPSGRLINARPGMELDIERIAAAAAEHDVALEINASDWRLDLRDTHVRAAVAAGAKIIINSDAHDIPQLDQMCFGVQTARRGWATAADVVNTWPPAKLAKWLGR